MVLPFRRSFGGRIFVLAAMLLGAPALAADGSAVRLQAWSACIAGHRFEPGPIAAGRDRQPTVREFQERMRALGESELRDAYSCAELPVGN
jgi:hypothetical protein